VYSRCDLLAWFEIQELSPSGEYVPVEVDHGQCVPGNGTFLLHQGIQRRIAFTVMHDVEDRGAGGMIWHDVRELVAGRVRSGPDWRSSAGTESAVLSLNLLPAHYIQQAGDDRVYFRFEAAWDSSLHNSPLLNRVTPYGEKVYITISAYLEAEDCIQPACFTKDLSVVIISRDSRFSPSMSLRCLFNQRMRTRDCNKVTGVYEMQLRHRIDIDSPGLLRRRRRVLDTSGTYVRGEENLRGWRPRGDSIIWDHQWELDTLTQIAMTEKARHLLQVRDKLREQRKVTATVTASAFSSVSGSVGDERDLTKPAKDERNQLRRRCSKEDDGGMDAAEDGCDSDGEERGGGGGRKLIVKVVDRVDADSLTATTAATATADRQHQLMAKCLKLLKQKHFLELATVTGTSQMSSSCLTDLTVSSDSDALTGCSTNLTTSSSNESVSDIISGPAGQHKSSGGLPLPPSTTAPGDGGCSGFFDSTAVTKMTSPRRDGCSTEPRFVADVTEVRVNPVVSRRGLLRIAEKESSRWAKRWVVVRRPYIYIYNSELDVIERGLINMATAKIELVDGALESVDETKKTIQITTSLQKCLLVQTLDDGEFYDWLYAICPLLVGQIRSTRSRGLNPSTA
jgi:kinesin family protein 1